MADLDLTKIYKQAKWARSVVWAVFIAALVGALWLRWVAGGVASEEIEAEATAIVALANEGKSPREIVDTRTEALYATTDDRTAIENYRPFVRGLAHRLVPLSQAQRNAELSRSALNRLWPTMLIVSVAQTIIILLFPTMFHIRTNNAVSQIERMQKEPPKNKPKLTGRFWNEVWRGRNRRFLGEEGTQLLLWRRLGFATLMGLSSMYLLAPAGLTASMVGEFSRLYAAPGSPSYPFWFTAFAQASPFVIGLSGYLLYSLTVFFQRALINDVSHRLFTSLWNRGIIVIVLSLALTGIDEGSNVSRAMVFVVGVFPQTGIQAIGKFAQSGINLLGRLQPGGFRELPEIGLLAETALQELGVTSTMELANTDLDWLIRASGVDPRALATATDRALLHQLFTPEQVEKLSSVPVSTASELLLWVEGADVYAQTKKQLKDGVCRELAESINDTEKKSRRKTLCQILQVADLDLQIREVLTHRNVRFIIDNKLAYPDL